MQWSSTLPNATDLHIAAESIKDFPVSGPRRSDVCNHFSKGAVEAKATNSLSLENAYILLYHAETLLLRPANTTEPLAVSIRMEGRRSCAIEDFSDEEISLIEQVAPGVSNIELRARLADIVWCSRRRPQCAEIALNAYVAAANLCKSHYLYYVPEYLTRAFKIAVFLKKHGPEVQKVREAVRDIALHLANTPPAFVDAASLELLLEVGDSEARRWADLAREKAETAQRASNWELCRRLFIVGGEWYKEANDDAMKDSCHVAIGEAYAMQAEEACLHAISGPAIAANFLTSAIQVLRNVKGMSARREELRKRLVEVQEDAAAEMPSITTGPVDLTQIAEISLARLEGKGFHDSMFALAAATHPSSVQRLEQMTEKQNKQFILQHLMPVLILDHAGKAVAKERGGRLDGTEADASKKFHMHQNADAGRSIAAIGAIDPMRRKIYHTHYPTGLQVYELIAGSPFIPPGREVFFVEGVLAGLEGNLIKALHLLIPQFENSLRHILRSQGQMTSTLNDDGLQNDFNLNRTLYLPEIIQIFGQDAVFDFQGLLVEKVGANFRNRLAHGLLEPSDFASATGMYIWWAILRVCLIPIIEEERRQASTQSNLPSDGPAAKE